MREPSKLLPVLSAVLLFIVPTAALHAAPLGFRAAPNFAQSAPNDTQVLIANCEYHLSKFALYTAPDVNAAADADGNMTVVAVSDELESSSGLNRMTEATWNVREQSLKFPSYWTQTSLPSNSCHAADPENAELISPIQRTLFMYVRAYFIVGEPTPNIDLDKLLAMHEAYPVRVHVLCRTRAASDDLLHCSSLLILDEKIDVEPNLIALPASNAPVVELESHLCSSNDLQHATAFPISWNGKTIFLTSAAAVVTDGGLNSCNTIQSSGHKISLQLLKQDWGVGLAALVFASPLDRFDQAVDISISTKPTDSARIVSSFSGDRNFQQLTSHSHRHRLPLVDTVSELVGPIVDSTFIGTPVFNSQHAFSGIILHQNLEIHPGGQSRVRDGFLENPSADHLLLLSGSDINEWLKQLQTRSPSLNPVIAAQKRTLDWDLGPLRLTQSCPGSGGSSGSGPIGGVEPVGIGGDESGLHACWIDLALNSDADQAMDSASLPNTHWFKFAEETRELLKKQNVPSIRVSFGIFRDLQNELQAKPLFSAADFAYWLARDPAFLPVRILPTAASSQLGVAAERLVVLIRQTKENLNSDDIHLQSLLQHLQVIALLSQSLELSQLQRSDFELLLKSNSPYADAWGSLQADVAAGVQVRPQFQKLADLFTTQK